MRKVTASAVILTALTGCGHNSGIPSTEWSFEIPSGEEVSSLVNQSAGKELGSILSGDMIEPAFNQPPEEMKTASVGWSTAGPSGRSGLGSSALHPSIEANGGSAFPINLTRRYQSAATRPDPVANVKALLSTNSSFDALSQQEPARSDILTSSQPTVYPPDLVDITSTLANPAITSTLGAPTSMELQAAYADNVDFTSAGLPALESSVGGVYGLSDSSAGNSSSESSTAALNQSWPDYPEMDYPTVNNAVTAPVTLDDGLPVLEASSIREMPGGTAILQNRQRMEAKQAMQSLPTAENSNGSINIEILPTAENSNGSINIEILPTAENSNGSNKVTLSLVDKLLTKRR